MNNYGAKLKELRTRSNLSQEQLGSELGMDRSVISRLENNAIKPSIDQFEAYSKFFNVPISELLGESIEDNQQNKKADNYIQIWLLILSIVSVLLSPFGILINIPCIIMSFKKKTHLAIKLFCIFSFLFCIKDILFLFGIDIVPTILIIR